ncbi:AAA family ATPase [Acrocarpospora catenulata]|uniref:AAA family ATPase n=1 Tax=Acrocarpospora catenulata TaxID=2836182 RepID=UPI001BDA89C2|nr:LuxR family transcriptional regulator [Acrocarpospora catenulata]
MGTTHVHQWPLAGRGAELAAIETVLAAGETDGLALIGDPGVGKTRLAREALARWTAAGGAAEWVAATRAAASIPFGALSHLLPGRLWSAESRVVLLARVTDRMAARTAGRPTLFVVDDAHLLDESSAALLRQLAAQRLVIPLVTVRCREPADDAVAALWKEAAVRLQVGPLTPAAVDRLLGLTLDGRLDPLSRRRLHRLADGNPLLLRELLADAVETGALARRDGLWRWRGGVPARARVADLVTSRLRTLDPAARGVLELIACGEPLALALLQRLADQEAIEAAERSGMAVAEQSGARVTLRLAHPLYGEALRAGLPVTRARAIWGRLAEALHAEPMRRRDDTLLAGVWQLQSGTVSRPEQVLDAARQAIGRFELNLAERLARAARRAGTAADADWVLAQILSYQGRGREAVAVLPAAPGPGGEPEAMRAVTRALVLHWGLGRTGEAEQALDLAPAAAESDRHLTEATRSWIMLFGGRTRAALRSAEDVLARPDAEEQAVIWAAMSGAMAAGLLGLPDRAAAVAERGRRVADAGRFPWGQAQVEYGHCLALYASGRLGEAAKVAEHGHRSAVAAGSAMMTAVWAGFRGVVAKARGDLGTAQAALREAVALLEEEDAYGLTRVYLAELAGAVAMTGDAAGAEELLARADEQEGDHNRMFDAWIQLDRAWALAATGMRSAAADLAAEAAKLARDTEQPAIEAWCLYDAARLGAARAVRDRLAEIAAAAPRSFAPVLADAAAALATGAPDALDRSVDAFADHGYLLAAAEAARLAARARNGGSSQVRAARERAAVLAEMCPQARTPLLELNDFSALLTPREREIARLAGSLPSREIAERLGLSINTVNNTLARAYAKLGVGGRAELTAIFGGEPATGGEGTADRPRGKAPVSGRARPGRDGI